MKIQPKDKRALMAAALGRIDCDLAIDVYKRQQQNLDH